MDIKIEHTFKNRSHDLVALFEKASKSLKLATFISTLEKQSMLNTDNYKRDDYVGDAFEFFVEFLIKTHQYTNVIGITGYTPILANDTGVDGVGKNIDGEDCVVQIKFRSKTDTLLTANSDHLSNMFSSNTSARKIESSKAELLSLFERGVLNEKKYLAELSKLDNAAKRFYVFTTAKSLHYYTDDEMFNNEVMCFGIAEIKRMVDNNASFWKALFEYVKTIKK